MSYQIDFSSTAKAEVDAAFLRLTQILGAERAREWYQGLIRAIASLREMPRRGGLAREDAFFSQEIRQILYGRGRMTYRVVFTVLDELSVPTVRILHVRSALQPLPEEGEE
jgi:plasmid stabilization system protein ParE